MLFPLMHTLLMASSRFQEGLKEDTMHVLIRLLPKALSYQTKPWYQDWDTSLGVGEGGSYGSPNNMALAIPSGFPPVIDD